MTFAFRGSVGLWGVAMLLAGLPACGSSSSKCTTNCTDAGTGGSGGKLGTGGTGGTDATGGTTGTGGTKQDAAIEHSKQTDMAAHDGAGDGRRDAPVDLANSCAESLTAACSAPHDGGGFSIHCASTWAATTSN